VEASSRYVNNDATRFVAARLLQLWRLIIIEVNAIARDVCLSVYLLARLLKNACMDFDDILRVDGCRPGHG